MMSHQQSVIRTAAAKTKRPAALSSDFVRSSLITHRSSLTFRSAISLVEVLFAMGIMSVGILCLVLLIPLGAYEMGEAAKLDQSSTLGRAAFRDLEIRGYLQPKLWVDTQLGYLIGPDPVDATTYNKRLITYPHLPRQFQANMPSKNNANPQPKPVGDMPTFPAQYPAPQPFDPYTTGPAKSLLLTPYNDTATPPPLSAASPVFMLDPMLVSRNLGAATGSSTTQPNPPIQTFPYRPTFIYDNGTFGAPIIPRLGLAAWPLPFVNGLPTQTPAISAFNWPVWDFGAWNQARLMPYPVADRVFRSSDDILYVEHKNEVDHDRPSIMHGADGGVLYQGSYTWFLTIAPAASEVDAPISNAPDPVTSPDINATGSARQFNVSVVVCQNRSLDVPQGLSAETPPGEWMVQVTAIGGGLGGGEVRLTAVNANSSSPVPISADAQVGWMKTLRPGQWVMLSAIIPWTEPRKDPSGSDIFDWWRYQTVANWYRVIAVDDGSDLLANYSRNVTLHGPDWPTTALPAQGVFATVVEGVVGVFQKTITLDGSSAFSK